MASGKGTRTEIPMCCEPARPAALVIGGCYYVLDRLADPTEAVTLIGYADTRAVVRSVRGVEYPVRANLLSPVPPYILYRQLRSANS
jgi:hypothetical protein